MTDTLIPKLIYSDERTRLWHADSLNPEHVELAMEGRFANAIIFDAPYSEKTHKGHANGKLTADRAAAFAKAHQDNQTPESRYAAKHYATASGNSAARKDIDYAFFTPEDCRNFSYLWSPYCTGWWVSITDDVLAPEWANSFESNGLYKFCPLPFVETGSRVRMTGDGPSNWSCWMIVARPKNRVYASWGTLPGAYIQPGERRINSIHGTDRITGGKPLKLMMEIVSDYSREGELVVDPFCGAATTGLAALRTGRRFIGIEKDPGRAKLCSEILEAESKLSNRREIAAGQATLFNV